MLAANSRAYIGLDAVTELAKYSDIPSVVDSLEDTSTTSALSANQGYVLNQLISDLGGGSSMYAFAPSWFFTTSQTWRAPVAGTYEIIAVGKGGNGGICGIYTGTWSSGYPEPYSIGGGGGGAGGIGVYIGKLTPNESVSVVISTSGQVTINSGWIIANPGGNGADGQVTTSRSSVSLSSAGGAAGTVSGTKLTYSYKGSAGGSLTSDDMLTKQNNGNCKPGGAGGSVGICFGQPYVRENAGMGAFFAEVVDGSPIYKRETTGEISALDNTVPRSSSFGGGGCGGFGGMYYRTNTAGSYTSYYTQGNTYGSGGAACAMISLLSAD